MTKQQMISYFWLTLGSILQGIALAIFLFPHDIPTGGAAAMAVLAEYFFGLPLGITLWLVNFPLLIMAGKYLGMASAIRTMYAVTVVSIVVNLLSFLTVRSHPYLWLDILMGALCFGIGVGMMVRQKASNGGLVILALIIATYRHFSPGRVIFWINGSMMLLTAIVVDLPIIIYALITQWIGTRMIDMVQQLQMEDIMMNFGWRKR
ncbi:YitT family protein [Tuberibacillus sp. Marseille-P3662]|uniref:YitT family protein n=1 Tax=Tuberibacillus sp. Marseille-P3662 TaxID=1965358 RepID=UPI000A1CAF31|nr:YitT family protein [Tuberibacillus sp. Marseille-P3662]